MALEREKATYWSKLPELASTSEGKYVVIDGDDVAGVVDRCEEALRIGYGRFGPGGFLVKQVFRAEPILFFTRDLN